MLKKFIKNDAITIVYKVEGEGLPMILIHGFGEDHNIWSKQINFLKNYYKLIVPDLPGSGKSSFIDKSTDSENPQLSSLEFYVECVYTLLRHENISRCIMLGHSMGGYITLAFAEYYPHLLEGFGLIHSTAFADSEEKKQNRKRGITMIEEYGSYAFLKNTIPNLFGEKFKSEHPEKIESLLHSGNKFSKQALKQYSEAMINRKDRTFVLQQSKVPVLFITGEEDVAAPLKDVLQQVHLPKIAYIHILEKSRHMGMWEATKKMNHAILQFLQETFKNE